MKYYIVAVPLFNSHIEVEAYIIVNQSVSTVFGSSDNYMLMDSVMNSPSIDILNDIGVEPFTGGKPIFVDLSQFGLLGELFNSSIISPELMIYVLSKDIPLEEAYLEKCKLLKDKGFSIALSQVEFTNESLSFYDLADYYIVDIEDKSFKDKIRMIRNYYPRKPLIISGITDTKTFDMVKTIENSLFEGGFHTQPITEGVSAISPLEVNVMELTKSLEEGDFKLDDMSQIVARDTALAVSLLKFINSSDAMKSKVDSIKAAISSMERDDLQKWIAMAVSESTDKSNEITKLSLIRAGFAERLATSFGLAAHAPSLFLMGLISLLNVILEKSIEDAFEEISVDDNIREALVNGEGLFKDVLNLIYSYEQADWKNTHYIALTNNINPEKIPDAFLESLLWYKELYN